MARELDFPVFDVDNHLYETQDAFTRHLPDEYAGLVKYVQVGKRTKIALKN
ncbi:MAG: amidohydrolase, partial [Myxococcota bacterium]